MRYIESGPGDGVPIVLIHGNLSTGRFFEHLMPTAPETYRLIAPDMRGFGDTGRVPIDATRGLRDWADDTYSLVDALGISRPVHLVGWSTGGAAIVDYAREHPVASLTFIDPVSPYGFGGVRLDGTPCFPDYAGSGGGTGTDGAEAGFEWRCSRARATGRSWTPPTAGPSCSSSSWPRRRFQQRFSPCRPGGAVRTLVRERRRHRSGPQHS